MGINSIKIFNLLSFKELIINDIKDINCFVGRNNTGKSNLMKLIRFFYMKLEGKRELPPKLFTNYSAFGSITIKYDTSRIRKIVTSLTNRNKSNFFKHIYNVLFKDENDLDLFSNNDKNTNFELTLKIYSNDRISWSTEDQQILNIINYLYPFFEIETRHIDLYDWNKLWYLISKLKSFNVKNLKREEIIEFFDNKLTGGSGAYNEYLSKIQKATETSKYNYREKVLNYVKVGLKGQTFLIDGEELNIQSDGTNSYNYIEIFCNLLISLTRRDYIMPILYIDEPEIGLHPKRNEELIYNLHKIYISFKKTKSEKQTGKYKTPYPKIIFSTHSPNIVKYIIKLFEEEQQILHFSKDKSNSSVVKKMNSTYDDKRFLNTFSDNEARLFFSDSILFVEGQTELELFSNKKLIEKFEHLKKVDIYLSNNNVLSKYINPSYANTSIPYVFLFDLDKLIDIVRDGENRRIKFKNNGSLIQLENSELDEELERFKRGYNKKYYDIYSNIFELKKYNGKKFTFDKKTFKINESIEFNDFLSRLKRYLSLKNIHFHKTTIEESLINSKSKDLFFDWLEEKKGIKNFKKKIATFEKKKYGDSELLLEYLRVVLFGGKFEILVTNKNIDKGRLDNPVAYDIAEYIKSNIMSAQTKTNGWVSSFLDFAIIKIDKEKKDKSFITKFKEYFPELDEIIQKTKV